VEPKGENDKRKAKATGGHKAKHIVAYLADLNKEFMGHIFQNARIWMKPARKGSREPVDTPGCPNTRDDISDWAFFQEVPDINNFGKSISGIRFVQSGGNFMQHIKRLVNLHEGEAVEIWGQWVVCQGAPPSDRNFWHLQFAETEKDAQLLTALGALGTRTYQTRQAAGRYGPEQYAP